MRLAQLARKVGKSQSEIVKFLGARGVVLEEGSNTKVEDKDATLVIENFAPELLIVIAETLVEEEILETAPSENVSELISTEINDLQDLTNTTQEIAEVGQDQSADGEEKTELIKAPKIELQGLRVIGKIELPDVKKKEPGKEAPSESQRKPDSNRIRANRPERDRKNPITLQREREEQEKQEKQKEREAYLKELKTQRYLSKVRRPIDVYKEPKEKPAPKPQKQSQKKKEANSGSLFSRLTKWFFNK